jgi:hypothetical protein
VFHDLGDDAGAVYERRADAGLAVAAEHEDAEVYCGADGRWQALDIQELVRLNAVLLAAGADDGVNWRPPR